MRKPAFCICENKDADQLRRNREADQRLYFRYKENTISLFPKSEISSHWLSSVVVQPGLCQTWSETPKPGFLTTRLKCACAGRNFEANSTQIRLNAAKALFFFFTWFTDFFSSPEPKAHR